MFLPTNKIHQEEDRAKDLSASWYCGVFYAALILIPACCMSHQQINPGTKGLITWHIGLHLNVLQLLSFAQSYNNQWID